MRKEDLPVEELTEYRRTINKEKARLMRQMMKAEMNRLSGHWERIQEAHDKTTAATELRDEGLAREFYLEALAQMSEVEQEAKASIREIANFLVLDLNVAASTVGHTAGVAGSTVHRWLDPNRDLADSIDP